MHDPSNDPTLRHEVEFVADLCEAVNSPRSLTVFLLLRHGEYRGYMGLDRPADVPELISGNKSRYAQDFLVSSILTKSELLPLGVDRKAVAQNDFWVAEGICCYTNRRLDVPERELPDWLFRARRVIAQVLPEITEEVLEDIRKRMRHGPGAVVGFSAHGDVLSRKFDATSLTTTCKLAPFVPNLIEGLWSSVAQPMEIVAGNEWLSVPKNAKTDRGICKEPLVNAFGQLGIGDYIAERLRMIGVDLRYQEWNQFLAETAYDWRLATIDLSMASDLLASATVELLLPPEWCHLLGLFRSEVTRVGGQDVTLEKWCSMGNGYAFPLETLIFASVVRAIVPRSETLFTAVYGDDIICPRSYAAELITALEFLGFKVNNEKSFLAGSFFESCGKDYLRGSYVRPFYLRPKDDEDPTPWLVSRLNNLRLWSGEVFGCLPPHIAMVWDKYASRVRGPWRKTYVTPEFGDLGLIVGPDELCSWGRTYESPFDGVERSDGLEGYRCRAINWVPTSRSESDRQTLGVALQWYSSAWRRREIADRLDYLSDDAVFSAGREPIRGLFGRPVARLVLGIDTPRHRRLRRS